ncbi:MAG: hypothetical protein LBU46_03780 [Candidatus Accumulibacter sp.]|jgi:hypothetical protein|nr:hypothetical protein [Accumulibacter sp.]
MIWYDSAMIVSNQHHELAIVARRDGQTASFVRLGAGKPAGERMAETMFREARRESPFWPRERGRAVAACLF